MFRHAVSTPRVVCAVLVMFFFSACGGGGGGGDGDSTFAIEPDPVHTGDDCGCGGKTAAGSGMTFSTRQTLFPSIRKNEYVPGEVLVKFREGTSQSSADRIVNRIGSRGARSLFSHRKGAASRLKKVRLRDDKPVERAIEEYVAHPEVEYAEPNYIYHATATTPNDPNYAMLWGLNNTAQQVNGVTGTSGKDIGVETAWDTLTDCGGVVVAVLDTGINYNHRDLLGNMWDGGASYPNHGYDCVDDDNDPMDLNGHGTHCAGIIGANGNDGTGLTGVCWRVKLMAVRVLDAAGSGTLADIAEGIDFAVANGAHVINASLGGPNSATMQTAVANARTGGVIIVAAAGNDGTTSTTSAYPAAYTNDNIISVAAVDQAGDLASFSNYGTTWVDIAAPGVNILSTWPGQTVVTTESFQDWIMGHGWGTGTYVYNTASGPISIDMLTNPSPFGGGLRVRTRSRKYGLQSIRSQRVQRGFGDSIILRGY
ncbi:MAG: S8 family peptidase [Spirochaetota bacterium]